jgi:hypothetical protein
LCRLVCWKHGFARRVKRPPLLFQYLFNYFSCCGIYFQKIKPCCQVRNVYQRFEGLNIDVLYYSATQRIGAACVFPKQPAVPTISSS